MADIFEDNRTRVQLPKQPSLKLNALSNWVVIAVNIAIGFFLTPAILAHLGERRFGMWMLVSSITGFFGLLQLGIGTGVLRYTPFYRSQGEMDKVGAIISTGMAFYGVVGFVILTTSLLFAGLIADYFQGGAELAALIRLFGLAAAFECPLLIFDAAIRGHEGFVFVNLVAILRVVLRAAALFSCIVMGYGLLAMGCVQVIVTLLGLIAIGFTFRIYCYDVKLGVGKITQPVLKLLMLYGLVILVEGVGGLLRSESPRLIIGKAVSLEAVGFFSIVALLVMYYRRLIEATTKVLMPRFTYLSGQNADEEIRRLFLRGSRYVTIVAGAVALLLWSVGPSFLLLWVKNDNIKQVVPALMVLTGATLVFVSHRISAELLYGLGKQKKLAVFAVIEGVSVFGLSLGLSYTYGMTGVAIGVAVPLIFVRGIIQIIYACRFLKISLCEYYTGCIFKPWTITIALAITSHWCGIANSANNWPSLFLASSLIMVATKSGCVPNDTVSFSLFFPTYTGVKLSGSVTMQNPELSAKIIANAPLSLPKRALDLRETE